MKGKHVNRYTWCWKLWHEQQWLKLFKTFVWYYFLRTNDVMNLVDQSPSSTTCLTFMFHSVMQRPVIFDDYPTLLQISAVCQ